MKSTEIRERFLSFFAARGHTRVESDDLIPRGDPTVLFTSAGMNPFKDYFLGKRTDLSRAASCQKCLRTGDLENVGRSPSHHSFFEMLGNFSFGDYFKTEAIQWAWEFLTGTLDYEGKKRSDVPKRCLDLPAAKLWISVYEEDEEAFHLWRQLGVPENRIRKFGQKDNFWPSNAPKEGPNGPCGPCSEIYFDSEGKVQGPCSVELWNLVFTQFDRQSDGKLLALPRRNIDTGMGLERLTRVLQGVETDYETDLFLPIIKAIEGLSRKAAKSGKTATLFAIADHIRAIVFLIAEGLLPSNESRGYVLRMLIRRTYRLMRSLFGDESEEGLSLASLVPAVEQAMQGSSYSELLLSKRSIIERVIQQEERQFMETLELGISRLEELMKRASDRRIISGEEAFKLYDTYGFPLELTEDIAEENAFSIDRQGFESALKAQQERSRAGSQFSGGVFVNDALEIRCHIPGLPQKEALFVGYDRLTQESVIKGLWDGKRWVDAMGAGQSVGIVLEHSPFYGEAGGQIGDTGIIEASRGKAEVEKTNWVDGVLVHQATVQQGTLRVNDSAKASVDQQRRMKVARTHTATHLLHWALRSVLGPEAVQAGSFVDVERVRFDFSSLKALHEEQRYQVESLVNSRVRLVDPVSIAQMPLEQAKKAGALALFGEKYESRVRVVTIGDYSKELCGGTHVPHTGFVGNFAIVQESSIAAGTRRLEVLVGEAAITWQQQNQRWLQEAARRLGRPAHEVISGLEELLDQLKQGQRQRQNLQQQLARVRAERLVAEGKKINGVTLVISTIQQADRELLVTMADALRLALKENGVIFLASALGSNQAAFVMSLTADLVSKLHSGEILKAVAPIACGSGGGRAEFAQAGGKDPSAIPAVLSRAEQLVREALLSP
ncbi:MAG: alanine--tRNA ligase [Candidatus Omnitrophica bacterium]|nr:alanine--tRNA ligase [Candidatus Omnitrophota bacterium]